jgi:hypothetical protein
MVNQVAHKIIRVELILIHWIPAIIVSENISLTAIFGDVGMSTVHGYVVLDQIVAAELEQPHTVNAVASTVPSVMHVTFPDFTPGTVLQPEMPL